MPVEFILLSVQVVISFLGVLGNVLVFLVVYNKRHRRSGTDVYIQVLAVADLLVLSVNFPLAVIKEKLPTNWPFGKFTCCYLYPLPETFYGTSVWTIVAIAVERYTVIVKRAPIKGERVLCRARKISAFLWGVSFLTFALPLYFAVEYSEKPTGETLCYPNWSDNATKRRLLEVGHNLVLLLCSYLAPATLILLTYLAVSRKLYKSSEFLTTANGLVGDRRSFTKVQQLRLAQNRKARGLLTPIVIVFVLCMLPLNTLRTVFAFHVEISDKEFFPTLVYFISVCVIVNSAVNPLIYSLISQEFRKETKRVCRKWNIMAKRTRIERPAVNL